MQIARNEAEFSLNNGVDGSFLIRESESNPGDHSISLRFEGKVFHYRVAKSSAGVHISKEYVFPSLLELIEHHSKRPDGLVAALKVCRGATSECFVAHR